MKIKPNINILILGAGCWGSTLATIYAEKGYNIYLWEPEENKARILRKTRKLNFFPYVKISSYVEIGSQIESILKYDLIFLVTPSQYVKETLEKISKFRNEIKEKIFISCVKGLDQETLLRPTQLINKILHLSYDKIFVFSGPSHAEEVAQHKPTAITLAGKSISLLKKLQKLLSTNFLRVYTNTDIIGVELGGILKNIYAIACGICDKLQLGDNAKAALLSRSIKEMVLIGKLLGGKTKTFFGLSGLGDLLTTAYSKYSRNRTFGEFLPVTQNIEFIQKKIKTTIEGIKTVKIVHIMAQKYNLDLPIVEEVYKIIYKNKPIDKAITTLFSRKLKPEFYNYL